VRERAVPEADQVELLGSNPQAAVPRLEQREDAVARKPGGVGRVEDGEADAVEANQSVEGRRPEIAVAALEQLVDGVDGQPILHRPRLVDERLRRWGGGDARSLRPLCGRSARRESAERRQRQEEHNAHGRRRDGRFLWSAVIDAGRARVISREPA
jgi:hypothetical protein